MNVTDKTRATIEKARNGETLTEDEMAELYCDAPALLDRADQLAGMLGHIAKNDLSAADAKHLAQRAIG